MSFYEKYDELKWKIFPVIPCEYAQKVSTFKASGGSLCASAKSHLQPLVADRVCSMETVADRKMALKMSTYYSLNL